MAWDVSATGFAGGGGMASRHEWMDGICANETKSESESLETTNLNSKQASTNKQLDIANIHLF